MIVVICITAGFAATSTGEQTPAPIPVTVIDLLTTPEKYAATNLSVQGTITSQCGSGCWFILSDDTGDLYVNLKPNDFVIPPSMGKEVVVNGTILDSSGDVAFIGSSVAIDGKKYP